MADELVVWGRASSANVQKVLWALEELDLPYRRIDAGFTYGVVDTDEYALMNPNRRVPTIVDGDLTMYESSAIVRYLVRKHGGGPLLPAGGEHGLAIADQWMEWAAATFARPASNVFWQNVRIPKDQLNPQSMAEQHALLMDAVKIIDDRLAQVPWLAGEQFSMAEIPIASWMYRYYDINIERPDLHNMRRWYDALTERKAFRDTVMTSYEELRAEDQR